MSHFKLRSIHEINRKTGLNKGHDNSLKEIIRDSDQKTLSYANFVPNTSIY